LGIGSNVSRRLQFGDEGREMRVERREKNQDATLQQQTYGKDIHYRGGGAPELIVGPSHVSATRMHSLDDKRTNM
jgi:hypothetical protein